MILAAAVCPHPPLLVPELAPGTADELADLRDACDAAVAALLASSPRRVVVLGTGGGVDQRDESAGGTLAGYGVGVRAGGQSNDLPLSLTLGAWLLDRAGWHGPRTYTSGRPSTDGEDVALLVMADGTTKRSLQAPGFLDERAEGFDASVASALGSGDAGGLAALDPDLAEVLGATGVPALRLLGETAKGAAVSARLRFDGAPLGVGYVVADWVF